MKLLEVFQPNKVFSRNALRILVLIQVGIFLTVWAFAHTVFLPKPAEILNAFLYLWNTQGLAGELITSLVLNFQAIAIASVVSLLLAYAIVIPFFRPIVALLSKLRFLSLAGLTFFFTLMANSGHELKLYLLVFSVSTFYITAMASVVMAVPKELFDLARTLRMNEWRTVWEAVVLGQADKAFDVLRQNAAMAWAFLTLVEGVSRSEGGIGAMLLNQNKYFRLDAVFAIQITILLLGLGQDYAIGLARSVLCPYADLKLERK